MKITLNTKNIKEINEENATALAKTAEAIKTDLIQSQTMPFDIGYMQNDSTYVDDKKVIKGCAKIIVDAPYARKVYFDPEITIKTDKNPNAKQYYFEDYMTGDKRNLAIKYFQKFMKGKV